MERADIIPQSLRDASVPRVYISIPDVCESIELIGRYMRYERETCGWPYRYVVRGDIAMAVTMAQRANPTGSEFLQGLVVRGGEVFIYGRHNSHRLHVCHSFIDLGSFVRLATLPGVDTNKYVGSDGDDVISVLHQQYCEYCRQQGQTPRTWRDMLREQLQVLGYPDDNSVAIVGCIADRVPNPRACEDLCSSSGWLRPRLEYGVARTAGY